ncbi:hypothetical protein D9613_005895 [Agrocybe pediades]|uniref:Uncharacterized protein n=1 Tax=Agrocybe pediades TaxID=84607 RepID=A0A8H4QWF5_9AGAR|nr:hypothetical protein D9613_005895 [Agrocybe pediades]
MATCYTHNEGRLPQELRDAIMDFLHNDPASLRSCALAHRSLVFASQRHIFNSLILFTEPGMPEFEEPIAKFLLLDPIRLQSILQQSPHLASFVRNLCVAKHTIYHTASQDMALSPHEAKRLHIKSLIFCLQRFQCIECLGFDVESCSAWQDFEFLQAVQNIITSPSLKCLDHECSHRMVYDLRNHIEYLSVCADMIPPPSIASQTGRFSVDFLQVLQVGIETSLEFTSNLERYLDVQNLKSLSIILVFLRSLHLPTNMQFLLPACGQSLVNLRLDVSRTNVDSGGVSSDSLLNFTFQDLCALRTLYIELQGPTFDITLPQLVKLLATIPVGSANALEKLVILTSLDLFDSRPWDGLWDLMTDSKHFPRLTTLRLGAFYSRFATAGEVAAKPSWHAHLLNKELPLGSTLCVSIELVNDGMSLYHFCRVHILNTVTSIKAGAFREPYSFWPTSGFDRLYTLH